MCRSADAVAAFDEIEQSPMLSPGRNGLANPAGCSAHGAAPFCGMQAAAARRGKHQSRAHALPDCIFHGCRALRLCTRLYATFLEITRAESNDGADS